MRFLKAILPNLSIALSLALIVLVILDNRNPFMGFLRSGQAQILILIAALVSMLTAIVLYASWRRENK